MTTFMALFEVRTDNNPLTYVLTSAKLDATGHRWIAALSSYNFSLVTEVANRTMMPMGCHDFLETSKSCLMKAICFAQTVTAKPSAAA